jgi:hypothetical protein
MLLTINNEDNSRTIKRSWPLDKNRKIVTIHIWARKNLNPDEYAKWLISNQEHEDMVNTAVENKHAERVDLGSGKSTIRWTSVEIHKACQINLDPENHKFYLDVWRRFLNDEESISASSY